MNTRLLTARAVTWGGAFLFLAAPLYLLLSGNGEVKTSTDPGAPTMSPAVVVAPLAIGLVLTWLIPPRTPRLEAPVVRPMRETWLMVASAVAFPVIAGGVVLAGVPNGGWYALLKLGVLLAVPLTALLLTRGSGPPKQRWHGLWRWLWPLPAVAVWAYTEYFSPLSGPALDPADYPDLVETAIIATLTFLTASVLEEVFYRRWLQTRLEARLGTTAGVILASLLFAAMHIPTHHPHTDPVANIAGVIAFQGLFGLFVGSLWARYRNIWIVIAVHTVTNAASLIPLYVS
ncbi:type II CAAX endopeptidase family protein [Phytomonospora sp. NPDC050363]|uniref:CPBP family intramembrane glutamic endopeptidase n=1 Tax=Phytomonospora sp. NPDC050363 TaxID=3155642 RepID=UPI0034090CE3